MTAKYVFKVEHSDKIKDFLILAAENAQEIIDATKPTYDAQLKALEEYNNKSFFYQLFHKKPAWNRKISMAYHWANEFTKTANELLQIIDLEGEFTITEYFLRDINYYAEKESAKCE